MSNYWSSSPYPHELQWPKTAYHATEDAKLVKSPAELEALGPEWSTDYSTKKRAFPKMKFRPKPDAPDTEGPDYETTVVANPEEEGKLEGGWSDTPPAPSPQSAKPHGADGPVRSGPKKV